MRIGTAWHRRPENGAHAFFMNSKRAEQGFAYLQSGDARNAELAFRDAIRLDANDVRAQMGLGIVAHQTGHFASALELFERALRLAPGNAALLANRGNALLAMGRIEEAIAGLKAAIECDGTTVGAWVNLGTALHAQGDLDGAVAALERAATLQGSNVEILNNLGNLYKDQGRLDDCLAAYERALDIHPAAPQPFSNRLSALKLDTRLSPAQILDEHRRWAGTFAATCGEAPILNNSPDPARRLRIGYVSPDCHTALPAFLDALIAAHDRDAFEVFCYFNNPQSIETLKLLGVEASARVMKGRNDRAVAEAIHADRIDVLVDIAGHTGHNRLGVFARRPAPVQITWLDYLCTTGVAAMDVRLTDAVADPPGNENHHSERLLRLPDAQWCWAAPSDAPPISPLPLAAKGIVTFGSFNHVQKLTDSTLKLWCALLDALPGATLLLAGVPNGFARRRVIERLGGDATRLTFLERLPGTQYRAAINRVDIALDPMPFSGATTTLDALFQGIPVLTLPGPRSCSRSTASILSALKRSDWIANDAADFVARATALTADVQALAAVRQRLRDELITSPLMDTRRFVRNLEAAYRSSWESWCSGNAAERARHAALIQTRAEIERGDAAGAMARVMPVWRATPHWEHAKRLVASAGLGWARANPQARPAWATPPIPVARTRVSAVVCSIRPDYFAAVSRELHAQFASHDFELIGIHDARSLCEAYNRGAARASGDVLVFCHDDISFPHAKFATRVLSHLQSWDVIGVSGTDRLVSGDWTGAGAPHLFGQVLHRPRVGEDGLVYYVAGLQGGAVSAVMAVDGVFMALHRRVWEATRFDEETFDGFHLYDIDFSYRAHGAGFHVGVAADLLLVHFSSGTYDTRWHHFNKRFLRKFPGIAHELRVSRHTALNVKLQSLEQVERLHAALLQWRYGALDAAQ
jgi:predicted O-linked N-acetylglucosamine transferase (SPINDLY family)